MDDDYEALFRQRRSRWALHSLGRGARPLAEGRERSSLLLKHGADINAKDKEGRTALQHAKAFKRDSVADFLRAHGATE